VYFIRQDWDHALADYQQAIALKPDLVEAYLNRGLVYSQMGEEEKAIADFQKVLELTDDPTWRRIAEEELRKRIPGRHP
jgi:regulator of sirC expression with transglutaminase-like and TPR domain